jgi:hypothetical protein
VSWLVELLRKAFRGQDFEAVIDEGYSLEFWRRFSPPPGRETPENETEVACVLETRPYTFLVLACYWHQLALQTAQEVDRDQVIRTFDTGYAALGDRARLLVLTKDDEVPDLVKKYWEDPALLASKMTNPPAGLSPAELAQRIGWTNWYTLRVALACRIGETPINRTLWNFAKDLVAYLDLIMTRGSGLRARAAGRAADNETKGAYLSEEDHRSYNP